MRSGNVTGRDVVHHYQHHIGDYEAATAHLTWDEDMAYIRLMRVYYRDEKPLPKNPEIVCKIVRAKKKSEMVAVRNVLEQFFTLMDDGWHNKRCDKEIERYREKSDKARKAANAKHSHSGRTADAVPTVNRKPLTVNHHPQTPSNPTATKAGVDDFSADEEALFNRLRRLGVISAAQCVRESQLIRSLSETLSAVEHYETKLILPDGTSAFETPGRVLFWRLANEETSGLGPDQGWIEPDNSEFIRRKRSLDEQAKSDQARKDDREHATHIALPSAAEVEFGPKIAEMSLDDAIAILPEGNPARNLAMKKKRGGCRDGPAIFPMIRTALIAVLSNHQPQGQP